MRERRGRVRNSSPRIVLPELARPAELREEPVAAEIEAVAVDLDRLRDPADAAVRLEAPTPGSAALGEDVGGRQSGRACRRAPRCRRAVRSRPGVAAGRDAALVDLRYRHARCAARAASSSASCVVRYLDGRAPARCERPSTASIVRGRRPVRARADERGVVPSRTPAQKSRISSASGSVASILRRDDVAGPVGQLELAERLRVGQRSRPSRRSGRARRSCRRRRPSSREPTIAVRRSLLGESHESSRCAIAPAVELAR